MRLWKLRGGGETEPDMGIVRDVEFTRDGQPLAAAGTGPISMWNARTERRLRRLASSGSDIGRLELAPGGRVAAGPVNTGKALRLWDTRTGRVLKRTLPGGAPAAIKFSADGRTLAYSSWDNTTIYLREAASGREIGRLVGGENADGIALDPDGRQLAAITYSFTGGQELRTLQLWDVGRRQRLGSQPLASGTGEGFDGSPELEFSPDGRTLGVVGLENRPLFFNVNEKSWPDVACRIAGRDLSRSEWARFVGPGFDYAPTCSGA
jgi:WD40 repeat protein